MLNHTKKIKEIYEDIQRKLFYMIPEKWDALYLYSSVIELAMEEQAGELFFYYIPKGIFRKNPVNVYEIPTKFNIDEKQYLQLVEILYNEIKELREEFKKSEPGQMWSNITISIQNMKFKVEYFYDDLTRDEFNSYERHVIWRYRYLGIGPEQVSKKDKEILLRYMSVPRNLNKGDEYNSGIYIEQDIKNIIEYNTEDEENIDKYDEYNFEESDNENTNEPQKKYNQFKSEKIENAWDHRKKKRKKRILQIEDINDFLNLSNRDTGKNNIDNILPNSENKDKEIQSINENTTLNSILNIETRSSSKSKNSGKYIIEDVSEKLNEETIRNLIEDVEDNITENSNNDKNKNEKMKNDDKKQIKRNQILFSEEFDEEE